jgi:hypothetical protein
LSLSVLFGSFAYALLWMSPSLTLLLNVLSYLMAPYWVDQLPKVQVMEWVNNHIIGKSFHGNEQFVFTVRKHLLFHFLVMH